MNKPSLSIVFITKNEEFHIGNAIDNVRDVAEEVFVVDSGSTDRTVEIAKAKGAQVLFHSFEGFGAQWNWALDNCPIKSAWTMKMDPDERLTEELKEEICQTIKKCPNDVSGFSFDRVLWFMGKCLRGVKGREERIWRTGKCRFTPVSVNEHPLIEGRVVKLRYTMDHYDSRDLEHWLSKQNKYTTAEARLRFEHGAFAVVPRFWGNSLERRMWLKRIFFRIPGRYMIKFLYCYLWLGAWKSGRVGWHWARMRVFVTRLIELKWIEMEWSR